MIGASIETTREVASSRLARHARICHDGCHPTSGQQAGAQKNQVERNAQTSHLIRWSIQEIRRIAQRLARETHSTRRCHRMVALRRAHQAAAQKLSSQTKITTVMLASDPLIPRFSDFLLIDHFDRHGTKHGGCNIFAWHAITAILKRALDTGTGSIFVLKVGRRANGGRCYRRDARCRAACPTVVLHSSQSRLSRTRSAVAREWKYRI